MFRFVFKHMQSLNSLAYPPYIPNLWYLLRTRPFCATPTSLKSIVSCSGSSSFTVNYLLNSCGFSPEKALSASKYVKLKGSENADSVLNFFKDHGFSQTQIFKLVKSAPSLLMRNPEKTFLPKIEFLKSKGISSSEILMVISKQPGFLTRSLENHLVPFFDFLSNFLQSEEKTTAVLKRYALARWCDNTKHMKGNIELLKQVGIPIKNIRYLVTYQPRIFLTPSDMFAKVVEKVTKLGFNPLSVNFLIAVQALNTMSKSTRDKKVTVYKKWGWSEDEIADAFRKHPWCMIVSEDKITSVMEFWVNKMEWESSLLAKRPKAISYSLEKRIVPRSEVYKFLVSNGLRKPTDSRASSILHYPEDIFRQKFINPHKEDAPDLLKFYEQKLETAK